ncbi:unnamed protein product [Vitrella brassicaformis CCMP3155]|uniref:Uncharacterized protein n=1 Tax=Vitrella brassicaformis (strain CCMP3155) TaxID=1169540 RepID=A0A0G4F923_VITBC|nr:unnamed protein product [Vitrella brassicaformis CCMP3155]|eukprot:CEM09086.1 unnamed protein product [Vitrella brassicaformis CCMP3155]
MAEEGVADAEQEEPTTLSTGLQLLLTKEDISALWSCKDVYEQKEQLTEMLGLTAADVAKDSRAPVMVDFHHFHIGYCEELCLSAEKAAVFVAVMKKVLDAMQNPSQTSEYRGGRLTVDEAFKVFQESMLHHSLEAPPNSLGVFSVPEAKLLTKFATDTYFKHYKLYQYCLVYPRELEVVEMELEVEKPFPPPPLADAVEVTPPQQPTTQAATQEEQPSAAAAAEGAPEEPSEETQHKDETIPEPELPSDPMLAEIVRRKVAEMSAQLEEKLQTRQQQMDARIAELEKTKK